MDTNVKTEEVVVRPARPANNNRRRKKVCIFCADKVAFIDYKDSAKLRKFISERGKILPRRISGTCAVHQRELNLGGLLVFCRGWCSVQMATVLWIQLLAKQNRHPSHFLDIF